MRRLSLLQLGMALIGAPLAAQPNLFGHAPEAELQLSTVFVVRSATQIQIGAEQTPFNSARHNAFLQSRRLRPAIGARPDSLVLLVAFESATVPDSLQNYAPEDLSSVLAGRRFELNCVTREVREDGNPVTAVDELEAVLRECGEVERRERLIATASGVQPGSSVTLRDADLVAVLPLVLRCLQVQELVVSRGTESGDLEVRATLAGDPSAPGAISTYSGSLAIGLEGDSVWLLQSSVLISRDATGGRAPLTGLATAELRLHESIKWVAGGGG